MPDVKGVKCVLLDIEGTICPISFVKGTLFPYALKALPDVLASKWDDNAFRPYREAFPQEARTSSGTLQAHVEDLTKRDVKVAYLKDLQGYLWENGYKTGAYSTPLFRDVIPKLEQWNDAGLVLAIYSSGSVFAQKLLFGHVKSEQQGAGLKRFRPEQTESDDGEGDVAQPLAKKYAATVGREDGQETATHESAVPANGTSSSNETRKETNIEEPVDGAENYQYLISAWFDTTNAGAKTEASSYEQIAVKLKLTPGDMLFLSDNVKEVDAAAAANMQALMVDRPGNAPILEADRARLTVVQSLDEISLDKTGPELKAASRADREGVSTAIADIDADA